MRRVALKPIAYCLLGLAAPVLAWDNQAHSLTPAGAQSQSANTLTLGIGIADDGNYDFAKYSGVNDDNPFAIAGFVYRSPLGDQGRFFEASANNLGLDSRNLKASVVDQGRHRLTLEYREIPNYRNEGLRTPYRGGDQLTLPAAWPVSADVPGLGDISHLLRRFDEDTQRERLATSFRVEPGHNWTLRGNISREEKEGAGLTAVIFGENGGDPTGALAPMPIDQVTDNYSLGISHRGSYGNVDVGARLSQFENDADGLGFQSAFTGTNDIAGHYPDGVGLLDLAPDNTLFEVHVKGSLRPAVWARLSYHLKSSSAEQDEELKPYTINPLVTPGQVVLPRKSADAKVDKRYANLALNLKPWRKGGLSLRYVFDERDNRTDRDIFSTIKNDSTNPVGNPVDLASSGNRIPGNYDRERQLWSGEFNWRLGRTTKLTAGLEREEIERDHVAVATTEEDTLHAKVRYRPAPNLSGWLKIALSSRDADDYDGSVNYDATHTPEYLAGSSGFENDPLLRQSWLAERDRESATWYNQLTLNSAASAGLRIEGYTEDYDDTDIGLTEREGFDATLDLGYAVAENLDLYAYLNHGRSRRDQNGYYWNLIPGGPAAAPLEPRADDRFWRIATRVDTTAVGVGAKWQAIPDRLEITVDYNWFDYTTEHEPSAADGSASDLPDITAETHSLKVQGDYQVNSDWSVALFYRYEDHSTEDFAYDGVGVTADSGAILYVGEESPDYDVHLAGVAVTFALP